MTRLGFIGLGTNVGNRVDNLRRAINLLAATEGIEVSVQSPIYETAPVDVAVDNSFRAYVADVAAGDIEVFKIIYEMAEDVTHFRF